MFNKVNAAGTAQGDNDEDPDSHKSGQSNQRDDSNGSKEEKKHRKQLDAEISKGDIKMRAAIQSSYLSVSESEGEEETKQPRICKKDQSDKAGASKQLKNLQGKGENSSSEGKRIAAAMYSGLISHSDTSDEEDEPDNLGKRNEDVRSDDDDKELGGEADEDPDFLASDSPPDECDSVHQES